MSENIQKSSRKDIVIVDGEIKPRTTTYTVPEGACRYE